LADHAVLGVFEDAAQRDFHRGLIPNIAGRCGAEILMWDRLTNGCRFDFLAEHLQLRHEFAGTLVAVDGKKLGIAGKKEALLDGLERKGFTLEEVEGICWVVAVPSIEEWLMADVRALPEAIARNRDLTDIPTARRPGRAKAERTAKERLAEWTEALAEAPPLRGGLEYATLVGELLDPGRVGRSRNRDLYDYVNGQLPEFLRSL